MSILIIITITVVLGFLARAFYDRLSRAGIVENQWEYLAWIGFILVSLWLILVAADGLKTTYKTVEVGPGHWKVVEE